MRRRRKRCKLRTYLGINETFLSRLGHLCNRMMARCIRKTRSAAVAWGWGSFKNYVDQILPLVDHLPTYPVDIGEIKFIYFEKATKFCEISILLLSYLVPVKTKVEISQNFVAFSEYINFTNKYIS